MRTLGIIVSMAGWLIQAASAADLVLEAEKSRLDPARTEVVAHDSFSGKQGVALKSGVPSSIKSSGPRDRGMGADDLAAQPDLVFAVTAPKPGKYWIVSYSSLDGETAQQMSKARSKFDSLYLRLQIDSRPSTRRVLYASYAKGDPYMERLGVFELSGKEQSIRMWLPAGVRLDRLAFIPFKSPAVPKEAADYKPPITPPPSHPRLWVSKESLAKIKANLEHPEHQPIWKNLRKLADKPFVYKPPVNAEVPYNTALEDAAVAKAFCYLLASDAKLGREAADLMLAYLPHVEFGNLLDITREVGAAIYASSCVYDWCYSLLSPDERATLRKHMMRLSEEMEVGWPPFRQGIVNGHGNEAQINRDLLAMSIAIYDEDQQPYRWCAWWVLENLVPMRKFEYQSPRHNQGVSYAAYRFGWEMQAAWIFKRLCGREVFDPNIKSVGKYWLYMRLPDGEMLRDGDGFLGGRYWTYARTALLYYSYSSDPIMKGEFLRQNGLRGDSILFLLLDDPALKAQESLQSLPLTIDFGPILGGMVARTGWNMGAESADVVAEVKGGGYHFGNHQHADAGSFQIYYRGLQAAKLGQYKFYGTPYDMNFNKRSVAQSMMLVMDPQEKILNNYVNDGGSRFLQSHPRTPQQAQSEPMFNYGKVLSCAFGPDAKAPLFSYFSVDLTNAYSEKVAAYVRRFVFINLFKPGNPATMIVFDDITSAKPEFKKMWQINTLKPPQETQDGVRLWNESGGQKGQLDVKMILPARQDRSIQIASGPQSTDVFGHWFKPPLAELPEASGSRIMVSPKAASARDRFLNVLQACDSEPLPVQQQEAGGAIIVRVADRVVVLPAGADLLSAPIELTINASQKADVLCAGLTPGTWKIEAPGAAPRTITVEPGKNILTTSAQPGPCRISPVSLKAPAK